MNTLWYQLRGPDSQQNPVSKFQHAGKRSAVQNSKKFSFFFKIKRGLAILSQLDCSSANFPSNVWCTKEIVQDFKIDLRFQFAAI